MKKHWILILLSLLTIVIASCDVGDLTMKNFTLSDGSSASLHYSAGYFYLITTGNGKAPITESQEITIEKSLPGQVDVQACDNQLYVTLTWFGNSQIQGFHWQLEEGVTFTRCFLDSYQIR